MAIADSFKQLFARKKSIADISLDELRRERIRLEQEQTKYSRRIDLIEEEKKSLFMAGAAETSSRKMLMVAAKIKEKEAEARNIDRNMAFFTKQLQIISGFIQLKENQRILQESGISAIISKVDLQHLQVYVDQATVEGAFHMDKFTEIIGTLEGSQSITGPATTADKDLQAIVDAMERAKAAREMDPSAADLEYQKLVQRQGEGEQEAPERDR